MECFGTNGGVGGVFANPTFTINICGLFSAWYAPVRGMIARMGNQQPLTIPGLSDDLGRFMEDMQKETDRGVALVTAAFCEQVLESMLCAAFVEDGKLGELLFGTDRPLGTFSAKTYVAFAMGLLSQVMYADLFLIRKIRNDFAHRHQPASFEEPRIADRCRQLGSVIEPLSFRIVTPRDRFVSAAVMLINQMMIIGLETKHSTVHRGWGKPVEAIVGGSAATT